MKRLLFTALFLTVILFVDAQSQYSRVKLFANHEQLQELAARGLQIDHGVIKAGVYVICELSAKDLSIADEAGVSYEILIADVTKYYVERNEPYMSRLDEIKKMEYDLSFEWPVPEGLSWALAVGS